ncbi:MAG: tRNA delta(2)-isopentenylpyrophosphate transferase [Parcubacteria group bacterium Gr01-1014_107]|nr:MAG: tRNA delta(2)-isopentenylpyrophosphate transferase [Parcubacteria group bacterium Gr01-1014_107]
MTPSKKEKGLPKILVILGQTATGKSSLAVQLAKKFNGEIISADSRQVYKRLNLGTGKITKKEMRGVPHHLLDVVNPKKTFTVAQYKKLADKAIRHILHKKKIPIIVGGTGFYISALVNNISLPKVKPNLKLRKKLEKKSAGELFEILKKLDYKRAENIDRHNPRRLIRAIEVAKSLGKVPSLAFPPPKYESLQIGLRIYDKELKKKIKKRLEMRIKKGMIAEARKLHREGLTYRRMRELGLKYKYLADFLEKKLSKEEMIERLEKTIWQYAKRQKTWFKRDKRIKWIKNYKEVEKLVRDFI